MAEMNNNNTIFLDSNPEANLTSLDHLFREFEADYPDLNIQVEVPPEFKGRNPMPEMTFVDKKSDLTFYESRPGTPRHGTNEKTETFFGENFNKVKRKHSQNEIPKSAKKRLHIDDSQVGDMLEIKIRDLRKVELQENHPTLEDIKPLAEVVTGKLPPSVKQAALKSLVERLSNDKKVTKAVLKHYPGIVKNASGLAELRCQQSQEDVIRLYEMVLDVDLSYWFGLEILEGCKILAESENSTFLDRIKHLVKLINYS